MWPREGGSPAGEGGRAHTCGWYFSVISELNSCRLKLSCHGCTDGSVVSRFCGRFFLYWRVRTSRHVEGPWSIWECPKDNDMLYDRTVVGTRANIKPLLGSLCVGSVRTKRGTGRRDRDGLEREDVNNQNSNCRYHETTYMFRREGANSWRTSKFLTLPLLL